LGTFFPKALSFGNFSVGNFDVPDFETFNLGSVDVTSPFKILALADFGAFVIFKAPLMLDFNGARLKDFFFAIR
jgi:hypothetical protein